MSSYWPFQCGSSVAVILCFLRLYIKAVVPVLVLLFVDLWFILRGDLFYVLPCIMFFLCFFFSPFTIAITSLGEGKAHLSDFRTAVRFMLVCFCRFPLHLGVWEGLRFVIVALPGLYSYFIFHMWRLGCTYLFLISPSFCASGGLCFVIVAFPGYFTYIFNRNFVITFTITVWISVHNVIFSGPQGRIIYYLIVSSLNIWCKSINNE